ncbi:transposase IS3/IS911 family protein [endosymbiont of Acanthamoeba sp. UWC8]|uniref:IS3 family transposase n=1 Tax=endosymbiont of Acanthamoeba sp. UWC8 TaxID=86106 RepID=UPI0004D0C930|nr:IS3 family transposase [endosymbiont of Acanthamoeba sp. UWC8]AIF80982.1 transposase IS3/IS911 family protein [endosymbiont of Acanthamoeba sp. UWC8]AIF81171.1 transposase IS3/IS911 family protein [endosymbiont of Acanthamoeba sp. UWC8]
MRKERRRNYTKEFKVEAVRLVTEEGYSLSQAAEGLGISKSTIAKWKRVLSNKGDKDIAFPGKGQLNPEEAKLKGLQKELERVKRERDILKKALAYFADPLK